MVFNWNEDENGSIEHKSIRIDFLDKIQINFNFVEMSYLVEMA